MSQNDMNLANAAGAAFRADMNAALAALVSNSSSATEPSPAFAYQFWADTSGLLKIRNSSNSGWITIGNLNATNLGFAPLTGATFTGAILAAVGLGAGIPGIAFSGDSDTGFIWVSSNTWDLVSGGTSMLRISPSGVTFLGTGAILLPSGTTAQRPTPTDGMLRYNSDSLCLEARVNGSWIAIPVVSAYPFTTADVADKVEIVPLIPFDYSSITPATPLFPQFPWSAPVKISNPATLPAGNGSSIDISIGGEFIAVGHATTPFISIYQRNNVELVKLINPATLPASQVLDAAFSQSGEFLAVAHATTPFITIYQRAIGTSVFVKLADPATLPAGAGGGIAFSPNGEFLAVAHTTTPFVTIYQRGAAVFTKLSNPATLPAGNATSVAWSPDGQFLLIGHATSPFVTIYQRTLDTTFTKLSNPGSLPPAAVVGISVSNDNTYFACVSGSTPFVHVWTRSGTTFTKMIAGNASQFSDSADYPAGIPTRVAFSLDGSLMAVSHNTSPFVTIYLLVSGKWVKQTNPATLPAGIGMDVCWSYDREFLLVAHTTTPFITAYQTASDMADTSVGVIRKIPRAGT